MTNRERNGENPFHAFLIEPQLQEQRALFFEIMLDVNDAHALMLFAQGILSQGEAAQLLDVSRQLREQGAASLRMMPEREDLYLNMEAHIIERLGDHVGGRLHIGRSRNDLYATMQRIKCRAELLRITEVLLELRAAMLQVAAENLETIIPGYTHMQPAQPITYGHYLSGVSQALARDHARLMGAYQRTNLNPLGAGALAGTGFPIDRDRTAAALGFDGLVANSLDAVASRDYVAEILSAMALALSHLSRMNQDFYFWVTSEFSVLLLPDEFVAGSSIMPQKRNPILFEHISSKVSHVLSAYVSVLTTLKGAPYTHSRVSSSEVFTLPWKAFAETETALRLMAAILPKLRINREVALANTWGNFSTVTEVADEIVRKMGVSFRSAHEIVKHAVQGLYGQGQTSREMTLPLLNQAAGEVLGRPLEGITEEDVRKALDPLENVRRRAVVGGPAPQEASRGLEQLRGQLESDRRAWEGCGERLRAASSVMAGDVRRLLGESTPAPGKA
jgi:argininosuccinate lyase